MSMKLNKPDVVVKQFDFTVDEIDEKGDVTFIASTKGLDRVKDRVYPEGAVSSGREKLLYGHSKNDITQLLGTVESIWNKDGKLFAKAKFNSSPSGQLARQLVKNKELDEFSISFTPIEYVENKDGGYDFSKWELREISLVPVPAHPETSVLNVKEDGAAPSTNISAVDTSVRDKQELIAIMLINNADEVKQMVIDKLINGE